MTQCTEGKKMHLSNSKQYLIGKVLTKPYLLTDNLGFRIGILVLKSLTGGYHLVYFPGDIIKLLRGHSLKDQKIKIFLSNPKQKNLIYQKHLQANSLILL